MTENVKTPVKEDGQITLFHIVVVVLSLMLTISAWWLSKNHIDTRTKARFDAAGSRAVDLINDRMEKYEDALWAGVAAIESHSGDISHVNWRTFAENLRIDQRYPGINGIGVIYYHTAETLAEFVNKQRQDRTDFHIFPEHDQLVSMPITFIHPLSTNAEAVGLDVAHERNRRTAALKSRDTGLARVTGPIVLVQDAARTPGFLFYAPFYRNGPEPDVAARREKFAGTVYAPFVVHKLMEGTLAKERRSVRFSIRDGEELIYDEHSEVDALTDPDPMFARDISLEIYGREWTVDIRSNLTFRDENSYAQPAVILAGGLSIECLIIAFLVLMARANKRAVDYADKVTLDLRIEQDRLTETNEKLSVKNEELERLTYIASHDLKTPIRGISGLTEMVQEDLEDYFRSSSADPEVERNLKRIMERVARMDQLTTGIMNISRVDAIQEAKKPLRLDSIVSELGHDFGVRPDQIRLTGDPVIIDFDQANFCSVLENLIGNAIKYHHAQETLCVNVDVSATEDTLTVSVTDNGPGIDSEFHEKIFDVFQTLRARNAPESTGIGLAIVKKAVERHCGAVTLTSTPGNGASFTFEWPRKARTGSQQTLGKAA